MIFYRVLEEAQIVTIVLDPLFDIFKYSPANGDKHKRTGIFFFFKRQAAPNIDATPQSAVAVNLSLVGADGTGCELDSTALLAARMSFSSFAGRVVVASGLDLAHLEKASVELDESGWRSDRGWWNTYIS